MNMRELMVSFSLVLVAAGGCSSGGAAGGSGGATGSGGAVGGAGTGGAAAGTGGAVAGTGGGGGGAGGAAVATWPDGCAQAIAPIRSQGTIVELPVELILDGKPFVFGEPNVAPDGRTVTPLNVRFYVSHAALLRAGGGLVPVDIVGEDGSPAAYGVHLYTADAAAATTVRLLAPPGDYQGVSFVWGLHGACNVTRPEAAVGPLSVASQMTWPHTGYLFLRYEGRVLLPADGSDAGAAAGPDGGPAAALPAAIHMGGNLVMDLAPRVEVRGALSVPASGSTRKALRLVMDEVFKGAVTEVDLTGFVAPPGPVGDEIVAGERLRRSLPTLNVFVFGP
jgi:hypothetical protein